MTTDPARSQTEDIAIPNAMGWYTFVIHNRDPRDLLVVDLYISDGVARLRQAPPFLIRRIQTGAAGSSTKAIAFIPPPWSSHRAD